MGVRRSWRDFWVRRSRPRLMLAVVCLAAAGFAVGFVYTPAAWLAQAGGAFQAAATYLLSFGARAWLFAAGGFFVVCAALLIALPRRRPHAYWVGRPPAIAPVSVYVDAENQLQNSTLVRPFVRHLRTYLDEHLKGQRADLLYFADAAQPAHRPTYKELYRFGFRPIDVPHVPFEDEEVKDAVDMELSLHAFDRALHGGRHQQFILVTRDRDYLPLVFRLHALGHAISLWAADPPAAFWAAQDFLRNVRVFDLNEVFPREPSGSESDATPATPDAQISKRRAAKRRRKGRGLAIARRTLSSTLLGAAQRERVTLGEGIIYTLEVINTLNASPTTAEKSARLFPVRLGAAKGNFLKRLGYDGGTRIECWTAELIALGVLRIEAPGALLVRGETDPLVAASHMERFVSDLSSVVLELAHERQDSVVTYLDISTRIGAAARDATDSGNPLRALVIAGGQRSGAHTRYLCLCARALGFVDFEEVVPGSAIRVNLPSTVAFTVSESQPTPDKPDDVRHSQSADSDTGL